MVSEEFQIVVKKPLAELERELRLRFGIEKNPLDSSFIEDNSVVFVFGQPVQRGPGSATSSPTRKGGRRRRTARNRTRTRGWKPVATITNSLGQRARIYDVFVNALKGKQLGKAEQRILVDSLLRANGNEPSREQVGYFLDNTLEFLKQQKPKPA